MMENGKHNLTETVKRNLNFAKAIFGAFRNRCETPGRGRKFYFFIIASIITCQSLNTFHLFSDSLVFLSIWIIKNILDTNPHSFLHHEQNALSPFFFSLFTSSSTLLHYFFFIHSLFDIRIIHENQKNEARGIEIRSVYSQQTSR